VAGFSPVVVGVPPAPSPPAPPVNCPAPQLGNLCGQDAIGAMVGIILGGLLVLALLTATAYFYIIRVSRIALHSGI
jgi:hypothetical protein